MYFCPCSCNDPVDPDVDDITFVALPRNLSYNQDSYLDRYSVSARYVHNPKAERRLQHELDQAHIDVLGVEEDETIGLLSVIKAQDYPVNFSGNNAETFRSAFPPTGHVYPQSSSSPTYHDAFSVYASGYSKTSSTGGVTTTSSFSGSVRSTILGPAARVTSRLTSLLHSPPNESMDSVRDIGSSVDGDISPTLESIQRSESPSSLNYPEALGQEMDRGAIEKNSSDSNSAQSENNSVSLMNDQEPDSENGTPVIFGIFDNEVEAEEDTVAVCKGGAMVLEEALLTPYGNGGKSHYPSPHSGQFLERLQMLNKDVKDDQDGPSIPYGSPDSDGFSEEGVFLNMDELDNTEKSTTISEVSDDTCVSIDSVFLSADEAELEDEEAGAPRKMTLEEAINRAASDLSKITADLYGESSSSIATVEQNECKNSDSEEDEAHKHSLLVRAGRESPVRYPIGLKINIHSSLSDSSKEPSIAGSKCDLNESPVYPENEFNFSRVVLRKSSSLKSNKTPPGTPHRKKVVRFADAMGLDLESVRHVLNMESPPKIPSSALADLKAGLSEENKELGSKYLCACFQQPGAADNFVQKVIRQKVCLENAIITDLTITGFVRVSNISFHKSVRIRYTHNSWATFHDIAASYVQNSCDGPTDRFSFSIVAPPFFGPGSQLEFAVSFNAGGVEYWDNNDGKNYVFECFAKTVPTDNEVAWLHFL